MQQQQMHQGGQDYNNQNYHRPPSVNQQTSRPHSRTHSTEPPTSEEDGLLSYKHPPNFSEVMGLDFELEGGYGGGGSGQQFMPAGLNGDWQSDRDMRHRREMIQHM